MIQKLDDTYRPIVNSYVQYLWDGPIMITLGKKYDSSLLPGFIEVHNGALLGAVLYQIYEDKCEIAVLFFTHAKSWNSNKTTSSSYPYCDNTWLFTTLACYY